jgi:hypothetical protein
MGTRADFYVGRGATAEWIGSIAWDGDPEGPPKPTLVAKSAEEFRKLVHAVIEKAGGRFPEDGWPWPWKDSRTTDYSYAFDDGKVWACRYGYVWFDPCEGEPEDEYENGKTCVFPDMSAKERVTDGGFIIVLQPRE